MLKKMMYVMFFYWVFFVSLYIYAQVREHRTDAMILNGASFSVDFNARYRALLKEYDVGALELDLLEGDGLGVRVCGQRSMFTLVKENCHRVVLSQPLLDGFTSINYRYSRERDVWLVLVPDKFAVSPGKPDYRLMQMIIDVMSAYESQLRLTEARV